MAAPLRIVGGAALVEREFVDADVMIEDGLIRSVGGAGEGAVLDARGLLVLPGIVDIHGDGFERLIAPRPAASFDPLIGLLEADRQYLANGITTAYHAVTWSWEGGQRGSGPALAILETLERLSAMLAVDTRYHLRHETFNLAAEATILEWLAEGRIHALAFNDHMAGTIKQRHRPDKMRSMLDRSGLNEVDFLALIERVHDRADEVPGSIERLAAAARRVGVPMLSHDDMSPAMRAWYRGLGCAIAEFPINEETAAAAAEAGDAIIFGAPNVVRGGSHTGCPSASAMAARGLCSALASDYYYPALPLAPFRLAQEGALDLAAAWALVSSGPAAALGLHDRGAIGQDLRADLVLVEVRSPLPPRIVATIVHGRIALLTEPDRFQNAWQGHKPAATG
jgi:alpha-D-ribose 1-methylphosphonate 5-triphosphate diphosphatase